MEKERRVKHPSDSCTEQVHIITQSDINGFDRLFGGALMSWIDILAAALVLSERDLSGANAHVDAKGLSTTQTGVTFAFALVGALAFEPMPAFVQVSTVSWAAIAFLALFGTCLAFFLQNTALAHLPSATVSVVLCAEPVFTATLSAIVLGEYLGAMGIAGAAIVVACTVAATLLDESPQKTSRGFMQKFMHAHRSRLPRHRSAPLVDND